MKTSDFNYELPPELIAQTPIPQRDASRLLVLDKIPAHGSTGIFTTYRSISGPATA